MSLHLAVLNLSSQKISMNKKSKVILASGKMYIDLKEYLAKNPNDSILLIAVERLYPFPEEEIKEVLKSLPHLENVSWVQEELKIKVHGYSCILI